jgi:hypothetical protein
LPFVVVASVALCPVSAGASLAETDALFATDINAGGNAYVQAITCPTSTMCAAVGQAEDASSHIQAMVATWNGTSWTDSAIATSLNAGNNASLTSVSCPTATFCVAGGWYTDGSTKQQALLATYSGGVWSAQEVAASQNANGFANVTSVSCAAASACVAVGFATASGSVRQAIVITGDGVTWTSAVTASTLNTAGSAQFNAVSCASATMCVAVGKYTATGNLRHGLIGVFNGTTWTDSESASSLDVDNYGYLNAVSCPSTTYCLAGGFYSDASNNQQAYVTSYNGTTWTASPLAVSLNVDGTGQINAIACVSSSYCMAVGSYADASNKWWAFAATAPSSWASPVINDYALLNAGRAVGTSVTCLTSSLCVAGGYYTLGNGQQEADASSWDGNSWTDYSVATSANVMGSGMINATACASATQCFAGGQVTGTGWATQAVMASFSPAATAPGVVGNVVVTTAATSASVAWTAPSTTGGAAITGYTVTATPGSFSCTTATTSCVVTGLAPGSTYSFSVTATNSAGTSAATTASGSIPAAPVAAPVAPSLVVATVATTASSAAVSFTPLPVPATYDETFATSAGVVVSSCSSSSPACTASQLAPNTTYQVTLVALQPGGIETVTSTTLTTPVAPAVTNTVPSSTVPVVAAVSGQALVGTTQQLTLLSTSVSSKATASIAAGGFSWHLVTLTSGRVAVDISTASTVEPGRYNLVIHQGTHQAVVPFIVR